MDLMREAGLALRRLRAAPGYAAGAVFSLALAIGAATAVFSVVRAVLLGPMGIREPDRLVTCWETDPEHGLAVLEVSYRNFLDWRSASRAFAGLAAMSSSSWSVVLEGPGDPVRVPHTAVTASFFDVLGTSPALGRGFLPGDDQPGAERVALVSHGAWERRFGADPGLVGRSVVLDGEPHTVVGVMPRAFDYPRGAELWTPLVPRLADAAAHWKMDTLENRGLGLLLVVGRLHPDATPAGAARELEGIVARLWRQAPVPRPEGHAVVVVPFLDQFFGPVRRALLWLFAAVGLVLAIGCANVSGLMLTRATERRRSDAVRVALGAGRGRLSAAWLLEAGLLVLLGGTAGLLGARWLTRALVAVAPPEIPRIESVAVDGGVALFALATCALAALLCALAPGWVTARADVAELLAESPRSTPGAVALRARGGLVVVEIALAVALLVASGLVVRSFANLRQLDLGFDPANVLILDVEPRGASGDAFQRELIARIEALPEVEAAGAVYLRPLALGAIGQETGILLEGQAEGGADAARNPYLNYESATPGYFSAMRIPLLRGRLFDERDDEGAPRVAIVGESAARRLWPGRDPIGRRLATTSMVAPERSRVVWHTVVGVVKDVRYRGLDDPRLDFYQPSAQAYPNYAARHIVVRTAGDPLDVAVAVQQRARELDRGAVVGGISTLEAIVGRAIAPWRFAVWMFALFALVAFALAAGGLFSLVALAVALRSREHAVRMALGARPRDVSLRVLVQAARHALLGVALGLAAAALGAQALAALLFEVRPLDAATYAAVVAIVIAVTGAASLLPARRAGRQELMIVLREE